VYVKQVKKNIKKEIKKENEVEILKEEDKEKSSYIIVKNNKLINLKYLFIYTHEKNVNNFKKENTFSFIIFFYIFVILVLIFSKFKFIHFLNNFFYFFKKIGF
jgi:hypothetical protein